MIEDRFDIENVYGQTTPSALGVLLQISMEILSATTLHELALHFDDPFYEVGSAIKELEVMELVRFRTIKIFGTEILRIVMTDKGHALLSLYANELTDRYCQDFSE